jgi:very-short-patch-repair endonuclease
VRDICEAWARERDTPLDRALAELTGRQHGVVSIRQLEALGLGPRGAQNRAERGALHRLHRGVYAVGHRVVSSDGARIAAVLACGPGAVLSHRSAAAAWGLRATDRARHEITVARRRRPRADIDVRFTRRLGAEDVATLRGIPITSIARTLIDLAAVLRPDALERAVHQAEVLRLLDAGALRSAVDRADGRRGVGTLRRVLAEPDPGHTRSRLEERFLALCRRERMPPPRLNAHVPLDDGHIEVDALWARARVVVELDGAAAHRTARAFEADRRRDGALVARGYIVLRLTWRRVTQEPEAVAAELRQVLALRASANTAAA